MRFDTNLIWNGPLCMYDQATLLDEHLAWLQQHHYDIIELDAAGWTPGNACQQLLQQLAPDARFSPGTTGLKEAIWSRFIARYRPQWLSTPDVPPEFDVPTSNGGPGHVFVFRNFDALADDDPDMADHILHTFATAAWRWLLEGRHLSCLVLCRNAEYEPSGWHYTRAHRVPAVAHARPNGQQPMTNVAKDLMWNGPVCVYRDTSLLDVYADYFGQSGFVVETFDAADWTPSNAYHKLLSELAPGAGYRHSRSGFGDALWFQFSNYYHPERFKNEFTGLPAEAFEPIADPTPGHVFVFRNFDVLTDADPDTARSMLDELAEHAWTWLADGHYLLTLVHATGDIAPLNPLGYLQAVKPPIFQIT